MINTIVHLQNASEIGGTNSTPPIATTKLLAIKMGWMNNNGNAQEFFFKSINLKKLNFYQKKLRRPS